jgi:hypothetical protein
VSGVTTLLQKILKARQQKTLPQLEKRFLNVQTSFLSRTALFTALSLTVV